LLGEGHLQDVGGSIIFFRNFEAKLSLKIRMPFLIARPLPSPGPTLCRCLVIFSTFHFRPDLRNALAIFSFSDCLYRRFFTQKSTENSGFILRTSAASARASSSRPSMIYATVIQYEQSCCWAQSELLSCMPKPPPQTVPYFGLPSRKYDISTDSWLKFDSKLYLLF
jgi:hypothetical protein